AVSPNGDTAVVANFVSSGTTTAALAAVSIHKGTPGEVPEEQGRILWIGKQLTPGTLQELAERYRLPMPHLVDAPARGQSTTVLTDAGGRVAGRLAWTPDRPGDTAVGQALVWVLVALLAMGSVLAVGIGMLVRTAMRRAKAIDAGMRERPTSAELARLAGREVAVEVAAAAPEPTPLDGVSATQFALEYQPVFDLRSPSMVGAEALLRWTRPDSSGLAQEELSAPDLAAALERVGIMSIRQAATELSPLLGVMLSVSVSPRQVNDPVFAEKVLGTLGATGLQPRRLQLVLDATLLPQAEAVAERLVELRRLGVSIALANFVLGERTVDYLRPGLVDRVVLAPHLVPLVTVDPMRLKLVEATIEAARAVSLSVTVPNVGRKEEAAKLLRLGCREFRGPLLAPPMPVTGLTALILSPAQPVRQAG
ncbi:MAG TPA: EAL domain-containing protein, partial [Devosia sp.]|nr:EAL domain-containing protein [Devosia sp.]